MSDPSWIPSAVMQTVGALYAIFITCFVLVLQNVNKYQNVVIYNKKIGETFNKRLDKFGWLFKILTILVVFTELYNGLSLYYISESDFLKFPNLLFVSYLTFATSVLYIASFSYILIAFMIESRKGLAQSTSHKFLSEDQVHFLFFIIYISCVLIIHAFFIWQGVNIGILGSVVIAGFLLIVLWKFLSKFTFEKI